MKSIILGLLFIFCTFLIYSVLPTLVERRIVVADVKLLPKSSNPHQDVRIIENDFGEKVIIMRKKLNYNDLPTYLHHYWNYCRNVAFCYEGKKR